MSGLILIAADVASETRRAAQFELLNIYFSRADAMQTYWGFYITVVIGLLAYFAATRREWPSAIVLTIGFVCFAGVNLTALQHVARQRLQLCSHLASKVCDASQVIEAPAKLTLESPAVAGVTATHLAIDLLVILTIWIPFGVRRWSKTPNAGPPAQYAAG